MTHADRNRRRKAKARRIAGRANRTKTGSARAQRRAKSARIAKRREVIVVISAPPEVSIDAITVIDEGRDLHNPVVEVAPC